MTNLENLRKQAKRLQRWHRSGHYPVAARIRAGLPDFASATDAEILAAPFPLARAQQLIANEQGYSSWQALQSDRSDVPAPSKPTRIHLDSAHPQILTTDFATARSFYLDKLGFTLEYEYGQPPFYALVSRDGARLNLRFVHRHPVDRDLTAAEDVLTAYLPVQGVKQLYLELRDSAVDIVRPLAVQPWGAQEFTVTDPDGNRLCFAEAT